jgi:hypothetical protein
MNRKFSILAIAYCLGLGITVIAAAALSGGRFMTAIIPVGAGMMAAGPATALVYTRSAKRLERDCDEREMQVTEKSMKFTFYFMTFILSAYWAYDVAGAGTLLRLSSLIVCLLWGGFLGAYIVNKVRF